MRAKSSKQRCPALCSVSSYVALKCEHSSEARHVKRIYRQNMARPKLNQYTHVARLKACIPESK